MIFKFKNEITGESFSTECTLEHSQKILLCLRESSTTGADSGWCIKRDIVKMQRYNIIVESNQYKENVTRILDNLNKSAGHEYHDIKSLSLRNIVENLHISIGIWPLGERSIFEKIKL